MASTILTEREGIKWGQRQIEPQHPELPFLSQNRWSRGNAGFLKTVDSRIVQMGPAYKLYPWICELNWMFHSFPGDLQYNLIFMSSLVKIFYTSIYFKVTFITFVCRYSQHIQIFTKLFLRSLAQSSCPLKCSLFPLITQRLQRTCQQFPPNYYACYQRRK